MKRLLLVALAVLLIMPLAVACSKKTKSTDTGDTVWSEEYKQLRDALINDHVYFDFDRYSIRPDAAATLQAKVAFMSQFPTLRVEIGGHCDERGTEAYNMALGDRRAKSAYNYMVELGVDGGRMSTVSYGKEMPIDSSSNEAAWSKNRRAQFTVTAEGMGN